jgi:ABC-type phosphate/phosphonate transport system ATPase subunit
MEGLDTLANLHTLSLSKNYIRRVEGLRGCVLLHTLELARNLLAAYDDVAALAECPSLWYTRIFLDLFP